MVPPGGWVVATGNPASALIGLNHDAIATTYAVDKLVGYVQSRLTNPSRAMAQRVAGCANEVQGTWSNVNDPTVNLDFLLADTALGSGLTCGSLIKDVVREAGEPPPQVGSLGTEFTRFESGIRASVFEDPAPRCPDLRERAPVDGERRRRAMSAHPASDAGQPAMFTIQLIPNLSVHMPNSSPHICFSSGTETVPPSASLSQ